MLHRRVPTAAGSLIAIDDASMRYGAGEKSPWLSSAPRRQKVARFSQIMAGSWCHGEGASALLMSGSQAMTPQSTSERPVSATIQSPMRLAKFSLGDNISRSWNHPDRAARLYNKN
jgi:hypothetical protein